MNNVLIFLVGILMLTTSSAAPISTTPVSTNTHELLKNTTEPFSGIIKACNQSLNYSALQDDLGILGFIVYDTCDTITKSRDDFMINGSALAYKLRRYFSESIVRESCDFKDWFNYYEKYEKVLEEFHTIMIDFCLYMSRESKEDTREEFISDNKTEETLNINSTFWFPLIIPIVIPSIPHIRRYDDSTPRSTTTSTSTTTTTRPEYEVCPFEPLISVEGAKRLKRMMEDDDFVSIEDIPVGMEVEVEDVDTEVVVHEVTETEAQCSVDRAATVCPIPKSPIGKCRLLLNEFSTATPGIDVNEFIEIIRLCDAGGRQSGKVLKPGYMLLILSGHFREILFVANLEGIALTKKGHQYLFTVGSSIIENIDMEFGHANIQRTSIVSDIDVLPDGRGHPHAILLVHMTAPERRHFEMQNMANGSPGQKAPLKISGRMLSILKKGIQDMIVYGEQLQSDHCTIFGQIWPAYSKNTNIEYVVRDWADEYPDGEDRSVNRCVSHSLPLSPFVYKIGPVTPGHPNICDEAVEFIVSQRVGIIGHLESTNVQTSEQCEAVHATSSEYASISNTEYQRALRNEENDVVRECRTGSNPELNIPSSMRRLTTLENWVESFKERNIKPWEDTSDWTPEIQEFIRLKIPHLLDIKIFDLMEAKTSIKVRPNYVNPELTTLICKVCIPFFENNNRLDRPSSYLRTALMTEQGLSLRSAGDRRDKSFITGVVVAHFKNRVHLDGWDFIRQLVEQKVKEDMAAVMRNLFPPRKRYWLPTETLFDWIIFLVNKNVPMINWSDVLNKASNDGVLLGHLFRNAKSQRIILNFVGNYIHRKLIHSLISEGEPFSVILDSTVNRNKKHVVVFFIQTTCKNDVKTYFYRVGSLGSDLSGEGYWKTFLNAIQKDGEEFVGHVKKNFVGISIDGASSMASYVKGFYGYAETYVGRPLLHTWCMAHRVNLVGKTTVHHEELSYFKDNIETINEAARHFSYPKRFAELKCRGDTMHRVVQRIPRIRTIRWVPHEQRGISVALSMYDIMIDQCQHDVATTLDFSVLDSCQKLLSKMLDKNFVSVLTFAQSANAVLTAVTLTLEQKSKSFVDAVDIKAKMIKSFKHLEKLEQSWYMNNMLKDSRCPERFEEKCTLEDYASDIDVYYKGKLLVQGPEEKGVLVLQDRFLKKIQERVHYYFPDFQIEQFSIFDPKNFPIPEFLNGIPTQQSLDILYAYGVNSMEFFGPVIGCTRHHEKLALKADWSQLLESIVSKNNFPDLRKDFSSTFWSNALNNNQYEWSGNTIRLIKAVIQQPATSVESESAFSIYGNIETSRRTRISMENMNNIFAIRSNIPVEINQKRVEIRMIVEQWLSAGHCRSDDNAVACEPQMTDNVENDFLDEEDLM